MHNSFCLPENWPFLRQKKQKKKKKMISIRILFPAAMLSFPFTAAVVAVARLVRNHGRR
jgi:hypothetical protein